MTRSNPALESEDIVRFVQDLKQALPQSEPSA
jgi:hypothetical protein